MNFDTLIVFEELEKEISRATITSIEDEAPFTVETDASDCAIGAILSQKDRPVAFFSRTLSDSEQRLSSVEKEAYICHC